MDTTGSHQRKCPSSTEKFNSIAGVGGVCALTHSLGKNSQENTDKRPQVIPEDGYSSGQCNRVLLDSSVKRKV